MMAVSSAESHMKLYSKPGACSTAVHIVLQWAGGPFEVEILDGPAMKAPPYLAINPAGAVPAMVDGDFVLTQNAAIMGYIADTRPQAALGGDGSPRQRAEATRWLAFVNSDVHPAFKPIFAPVRYIGDESQHDAVKVAAQAMVRGLMETADKRLAGNAWLAGFRSFADPYFYMTVRWALRAGVDMSGLDNVAAFKARMDADPGVQAALRAEGLD
jgi:glutathione S-transferase